MSTRKHLPSEIEVVRSENEPWPERFEVRFVAR